MQDFTPPHFETRLVPSEHLAHFELVKENAAHIIGAILQIINVGHSIQILLNNLHPSKIFLHFAFTKVYIEAIGWSVAFIINAMSVNKSLIRHNINIW